MKYFFALLLVSTTAFAADIGTGCVYTKDRATCMVTNNTEMKKVCDVRIQVTTNEYQKTTKKVVNMEPSKTEFFVAQAIWGDRIERAQVAAICK